MEITNLSPVEPQCGGSAIEALPVPTPAHWIPRAAQDLGDTYATRVLPDPCGIQEKEVSEINI